MHGEWQLRRLDVKVGVGECDRSCQAFHYVKLALPFLFGSWSSAYHSWNLQSHPAFRPMSGKHWAPQDPFPARGGDTRLWEWCGRVSTSLEAMMAAVFASVLLHLEIVVNWWAVKLCSWGNLNDLYLYHREVGSGTYDSLMYRFNNARSVAAAKIGCESWSGWMWSQLSSISLRKVGFAFPFWLMKFSVSFLKPAMPPCFQANEWKALSPTGSIPSARWALAAVWSDVADGFYVFGGHNGTSLCLSVATLGKLVNGKTEQLRQPQRPVFVPSAGWWCLRI